MSPPDAAGAILVSRPKDGVAAITLNRPERLNALTREAVAELNATLDRVAEDDTCRAVILTGAGRGFCSGQDVVAASVRAQAKSSSVPDKLYWQEQFAGIGRRLRGLPQLVVAAVNGPAAGAGMALALSADIRFMAPQARLIGAAVRLGLSAGECGASYLLPRLIGVSRAFDILLTGRPVEAAEAERIGLCLKVVEPERLVEEAIAYAATAIAHSPFSVRHTKRLIWQNLDASYDMAIELENRTQILATTMADYAEATRAFAEKRPPRFEGE